MRFSYLLQHEVGVSTKLAKFHLVRLISVHICILLVVYIYLKTHNLFKRPV